MACSAGGRADATDPLDLSWPEEPDGGGDSGGGQDDGGGGGRDGGEVGTGLPCTPGAHRCGPAQSVQICNSSGTAWLHAQTCAVSCMGGLCTGACAAGQRRCSMNAVEECNMAGTAWAVVERCTTFCASGQCALAGLEVAVNRDLDGEVFVDGDVIVRSGATLHSPRGSLTLHARSITVENGATIAAAPSGDSPEGRGADASYSSTAGGGGGYGTAGALDSSGYAAGGRAFGSDRDIHVQPGGRGGSNTRGGIQGGLGGGVIRLLADHSIHIAGFVTANGASGGSSASSSHGGGGGGSGGGILLAAGGDITVSGTLSAQGAPGGTGNYRGGQGGLGRVKILAGGKRMVTGTLTGVRTEGLLPPTLITSSSHPDPDRIYNDDFPAIELAWVRPFASRQGYYHLTSQSPVQVPTPATGAFVPTEMLLLMPSAVRAGSNYFHIVPVDAMSNPGTVEANFRIQINSTPPSLSSASHPNPTRWEMNRNVFYQWTFPTDDAHVKGIYYVIDRHGDTVPARTDTFVPAAQKQLLRSDMPPGIWVMHVVSVDHRDYLTRAASHLRVSLGEDPGTGAVLGQVVDRTGKGVEGATVTLNRGLYTQLTNSTGHYNLSAVPAGTWELRASKMGFMAVVRMIDVTRGGATTANLVFP